MRYKGNKTAYLTYYTWFEKPDLFADDEYHAEIVYGTIDIFSKGNFKNILEEVKKKLKENGLTYGEVKTLAGAIECKVALELSEATLYSDDQVKEQVSVFKSGTITAGIDDDDDNIFAELLGKTIDEESGLVTSNVDDEPIYVGFGHVVPKMKNGTKKYKIEWFPKVKFKPFMVDSKTKGDSLEFTTPSVEATIFEDINGNWEKHNIYDTEAEANTALDALFVQSEG